MIAAPARKPQDQAFTLNNKFFKTYPGPDWVREVDEESQYTPDQWLLDESAWQLLFVYNTFQRGHVDHEWFIDPDGCQGPIRRCLAFTQNSNFTMVKKNMSRESFPIALVPTTELTSLETGHIQGEIYKVRPSQFNVLDTWHRNTVEFIRIRVNLTVPYRRLTRRLTPNAVDNASMLVSSSVLTRGFKSVRAWMYLGIAGFWNPLIDAGYLYSPVKKYPHVSKHIGDCFYYSSSENIDVWFPDHQFRDTDKDINHFIQGRKKEVLGHTLSGYSTYAECKNQDQKSPSST